MLLFLVLFKSMPDSNRKIYIREFCLLCLKLIQSPDLQLDELVKFLYKGNFVVQYSLIKKFESTIETIVNSQVDFLLEIVKLISTLTTTPEDSFPTAFYINSNSVIGMCNYFETIVFIVALFFRLLFT